MSDKSALLSEKGPYFVKEKSDEGPGLSTDETSLGYMLKLAAPMVVTGISFTVMQFVDRFMVSRLGTEALAAILPAAFIGFIPASFAVGVMTSVNTFVSQSLGRGNRRECSRYCWQAIYMGLVYFAIMVALMWPAAPRIFKILGHEPAVANMEVTYLRIILWAQMLAVFIWASSQFFMGVHRPIITMYASICAQVVNIIANYVLIFGKFGFPRMGIAGAGWGTFIGIAVGAGIRMAVFLIGDINASFGSRRTVSIDFGKMYDLLKVGFPAGIGLMINVALWGVILFALMGKFGKEALAATSAVYSCIHVSLMPIVGIGTALSAAVGKAIGSGRKDMAIKQTRVCVRIALVYTGLAGICFFLFRYGIMNVWSSDDEVVRLGVEVLVFAVIFQVFNAAAIIYNGSLRGAGDTVWLAIVSALGVGAILGVGGSLVVRFFPILGSRGPWIAAVLGVIGVGLANRWRFKSNRWMKIDLFKRRAVGLPVETETAIE